VRVGVDLVSVEQVRESIDAHGERYTRFVYTERELADCTTEHGVDVARLAARFAAKEAALKALAPGDEGIQFSSIEVLRGKAGAVELVLSGRAAELAARAGVSELALSMTHEAGFACAVVVAS
jgi:holo-[acyl-carrier protein] synthase